MDVPLYALLNASDIVFTSSSTVGSEAILFNKPLICINLTNTQYAVRYDDEGVALLVEREEEILTGIDKVLHNKKVIRELQTARKRVQRLYAFGLDGRSSDRFVHAIKRMTA
jgi:UDP-N-acetylglucosamine 2-epimerase